MTQEHEISGWTELTDRTVLAVDGEDARPFLQNLVTNDVERVSPSQAIFAALLTPQGKFLFDFFLFEWGGALYLDCAREEADTLIAKLTRYRLRADVEFTPRLDLGIAAVLGTGCPNAFHLQDIAGAAVGSEGFFATVDPRHAGMGVRIVAADPGGCIPTDRFPQIDRTAYDGQRYLLAIPESGADLATGQSFILDFGFDRLNGVDFGKGCYIGQEVTARMNHRKLVKRTLVPITFAGPPPERGTPVRIGDKQVGDICAVGEGTGLALVKLEALDSGTVTAQADGLEISLHHRS